MLVKNHTVLPLVKVAQNTSEIDWRNVELRVFSTDAAVVTGQFALPEENLHSFKLEFFKNRHILKNDLSGGKINWTINRFPVKENTAQ